MPDEATNRLDRLLGRRRAHEAGGVRRRDWVALLISVVFACLIWLAVSLNEEYTEDVKVDVSLEDLPEGFAYVDAPPDELTVHVFGEGWQILRSKTDRRTFPLSGDGDEPVDLRSRLADALSPELEVVGVVPPTVTLRSEKAESKRVPVRLVSNIVPETNYAVLSEPVVTPDSVTVVGAPSVLRHIDSWPTETLVQIGRESPIDSEIALYDSLESLVQLDIQTVRVSADIAEVTEGQRRLKVKLFEPAADSTLRFEPDYVSVTYTVPTRRYEAARSSDGLHVVVNPSHLIVGRTARVTFFAPDSLQLRNVRIEPDSVAHFRTSG